MYYYDQLPPFAPRLEEFDGIIIIIIVIVKCTPPACTCQPGTVLSVHVNST